MGEDDKMNCFRRVASVCLGALIARQMTSGGL